MAHLLRVPCQGVFQHKYSVIHEDRNVGTATAKNIWTDARNASLTGDEGTCTVYMLHYIYTNSGQPHTHS